ncbi:MULTISPECIES: hypothetical protein [Rummeliibacillus]|uniref:hypothetical protein n=1 Tax=Rummeliibacillus TaxID=648802 RepID=UPI0011B459B3|nr:MULTISPECIES: hypothetical protein [Rummeliibacillus]
MNILDPIYVSVFFYIVAYAYIFLLIYSIYKFKWNLIGYGLIIVSFISYLLLGKYMIDSGIYADEHNKVLLKTGFFELILLAYVYIFIILAFTMGNKTVRKVK